MNQLVSDPCTPSYDFDVLMAMFDSLGYVDPCGLPITDNKVFQAILRDVSNKPNLMLDPLQIKEKSSSAHGQGARLDSFQIS